MKRMHFSVQIDAPVQKVWQTMLGGHTFEQWTDPFMPGSHFEGDWTEGSTIRFLAPDKNGKVGGMVGRVTANRPNQFVAIEYYGIVQDGQEVTTGEEAKSWAGAIENYTFKDLGNGKTEVQIDVDTADDLIDIMQEAWPKALQKLKELAEE